MFIKSDQKILAGAELTEFISYQRTFVCPVHFVLDNITCFLMAMKNNWLSKINAVDPDGGRRGAWGGRRKVRYLLVFKCCVEIESWTFATDGLVNRL